MVVVGGTTVGTVKPGLVGGRVEVTKRGGALVADSPGERVTQADKVRVRIKVRNRIFFIGSRV